MTNDQQSLSLAGAPYNFGGEDFLCVFVNICSGLAYINIKVVIFDNSFFLDNWRSDFRLSQAKDQPMRFRHALVEHLFKRQTLGRIAGFGVVKFFFEF